MDSKSRQFCPIFRGLILLLSASVVLQVAGFLSASSPIFSMLFYVLLSPRTCPGRIELDDAIKYENKREMDISCKSGSRLKDVGDLVTTAAWNRGWIIQHGRKKKGSWQKKVCRQQSMCHFVPENGFQWPLSVRLKMCLVFNHCCVSYIITFQFSFSNSRVGLYRHMESTVSQQSAGAKLPCNYFPSSNLVLTSSSYCSAG